MSSQFGFIDIILLAMFAGFIILRLRNILGRKTGHQGKPMNKYFPKGVEILKDIENNEAIKTGNVDENAKKQFLKGAEIAYETTSGPKKVTESFYMPSMDDVRAAILKKGGYVLKIRPHERSPLERLLARSTWWQVQLLRGIQFRATATSPGVALWKIIQAETNPRRQNILAPAREALSRGLGVIDALKALVADFSGDGEGLAEVLDG